MRSGVQSGSVVHRLVMNEQVPTRERAGFRPRVGTPSSAEVLDQALWSLKFGNGDPP